MRKLVLYALLSLDGVAESPDRYIFDFDDEMAANLAEVIEAQDVVLLGRQMYDEWAGYWPGSDDEPFASFINGVRKYVVTSTEPREQWTNTTVVTAPVEEFVRTLKAEPGGDIGLHGSIRLTQSLLGAGLVDELRLVVAPALAGTGRRLFTDADALRRLQLTSAVSTPSGALLLAYRA